MSKSFIDTNILVYTADGANKKKRDHARIFIKTQVAETDLVISTQVLQEFYVAATKKLSIPPLAAKHLMHAWENFEVTPITPEMIKAAIDCSVLQTISFWDALIVVAAEQASCAILYSEDLTHGQLINGVKILNPFHTPFGKSKLK